jgi:hypothetical protein
MERKRIKKESGAKVGIVDTYDSMFSPRGTGLSAKTTRSKRSTIEYVVQAHFDHGFLGAMSSTWMLASPEQSTRTFYVEQVDTVAAHARAQIENWRGKGNMGADRRGEVFKLHGAVFSPVPVCT